MAYLAFRGWLGSSKPEISHLCPCLVSGLVPAAGRHCVLWFQVRQAAFQSLGPFISTFANPSRAGLYIREDGTLSIRPPSQEVESDFASGPPSTHSASSLAG